MKKLTFVAVIFVLCSGLAHAAPAVVDGTYFYGTINNNGALILKKLKGDNYRVQVKAYARYKDTFNSSSFDSSEVKWKNGVLAYKNLDEACDVKFIPKGKTIVIELNREVGNCGAGAHSDIEGIYYFESKGTKFVEY